MSTVKTYSQKGPVWEAELLPNLHLRSRPSRFEPLASVKLCSDRGEVFAYLARWNGVNWIPGGLLAFSVYAEWIYSIFLVSLHILSVIWTTCVCRFLKRVIDSPLSPFLDWTNVGFSIPLLKYLPQKPKLRNIPEKYFVLSKAVGVRGRGKELSQWLKECSFLQSHQETKTPWVPPAFQA